jgi:hypothetical protein
MITEIEALQTIIEFVNNGTKAEFEHTILNLLKQIRDQE